MKNPIKALREKREKAAQQARLSDIARVMGTVEKLAASRLLTWDPKSRRLYIAEPVAIVMLATGGDGWENFLRNVWQWTFLKEQQAAWDIYISEEEQKAVRKAKEKCVTLTDADVDRIRRTRRDEITQSEVPTPKVESFELFILGDVKEANEKAAAGIIAVGEYNPETSELSLAMWDDVKNALDTMKEESGLSNSENQNENAAPAPVKEEPQSDLEALIARANEEAGE